MCVCDKSNFIMEILPKFLRILSHGYKPVNNHDLNSTEGKTLMFVFQNEGQPMKSYCEKIDLETGSFTYAVDKLEEKGLVMRQSDECDRRIRVLMLTEKGRSVANSLKRQFDDYVNSKLNRLTDHDRKRLVEAMTIIKETSIQLSDMR